MSQEKALQALRRMDDEELLGTAEAFLLALSVSEQRMGDLLAALTRKPVSPHYRAR